LRDAHLVRTRPPAKGELEDATRRRNPSPPVAATTTSTTASVDASHRTERDGAAFASVRARDSALVDAARDSSIAEQ